MKTFWEKEKEKKKMKKKAVSLLMVAAMMTTMAAGCGNKAANKPHSPPLMVQLPVRHPAARSRAPPT